MKKLVVCYAGIWAERLLTIERLKEVAYFIDDIDKKRCIYGNTCFEKKIYPMNKVLDEKKDDIIIIISDNKRYGAAKAVFEEFGLIENEHFFNGWTLDFSFYKTYYDNNSWINYEKQVENAINQENFNHRAEMMAKLIPNDVQSVLDIGCGVSDIKQYISKGIKYYGLDFCKRDSDTIICDFNKEKLPKIEVDMYYMAGLVYYIDDVEDFFSQLKKAKYILFDYGGIERYLRLDGVPGDPLVNARNNFISIDELFVILRKNGFVFENGKWDYKNGKIGWHMYLFKNINLF